MASYGAARERALVDVAIETLPSIWSAHQLRHLETGSFASDLLAKSLASSGQGESNFVADSVPVKLPGDMYTSLATCKRSFAMTALERLSSLGPSKARLEPLPFALKRLAYSLYSDPRRWQTVIRVILRGTRSLAILTHAGAPVSWRLFDSTGPRPEAMIGFAVLGLVGQARQDLSLSRVDGVVLHCGKEKAALAGSFIVKRVTWAPSG